MTNETWKWVPNYKEITQERSQEVHTGYVSSEVWNETRLRIGYCKLQGTQTDWSEVMQKFLMWLRRTLGLQRAVAIPDRLWHRLSIMKDWTGQTDEKDVIASALVMYHYLLEQERTEGSRPAIINRHGAATTYEMAHWNRKWVDYVKSN